jgi:threonine/homoserine/homoserine lactone efflux protein
VLAALLSFAAFAAVLTVTPGLDTLVVVRTAAVSGKVAAFAAALGVGLGCLAWAVASGLGLTAVLTASELAYNIVRWAGAGYLFVLGIRALRAAFRRSSAALPEVSVPVRTPAAAFRVGLLTNLLNPKVGIFYLAALPQFLPKGTAALPASILLGLVHDIEGIIWFALLIFVVGRAAAWLTKAAVQRRLEALTGVVFIGFGVKLALSKAS